MTRFGRLTDAPASFVLTGVRLVDPSSGTDTVADLPVVEGVIGEGAAALPGLRRLAGEGLVAAPGLCDMHTHLREPGAEAAETVESGARAAAHGGFTTICAMPNTEPPLDEPARVAWITARGATAACRVRVAGVVTRGRGGERLADLGALAAAGVIGVSDDGSSVASAALARAALSYLATLSLPLIEHCEEPTLAAGSVMRGGPVAIRLGLGGWPSSAELTVVQRDIALAAETGGWVHFTHLSTAAALEAVRSAKASGLRVTCDVTPHHVAMTDAWIAGDRRFAWEEPAFDAFAEPLDASRAYDASCRVNPPLPLRADALALLTGLADGTVDAIATDHAPHPPERKAVEFGAAAPGIIGLETALSLGVAAVDAGCLTLAQLLAALSSRPASLIGERRSLAPGTSADLVVFDPSARWTVAEATLASRSANTPLLGRELPGVVRLTVADGRITYDDLRAAG